MHFCSLKNLCKKKLKLEYFLFHKNVQSFVYKKFTVASSLETMIHLSVRNLRFTEQFSDINLSELALVASTTNINFLTSNTFQ